VSKTISSWSPGIRHIHLQLLELSRSTGDSDEVVVTAVVPPGGASDASSAAHHTEPCLRDHNTKGKRTRRDLPQNVKRK
jgi:hypothetical protein